MSEPTSAAPDMTDEQINETTRQWMTFIESKTQGNPDAPSVFARWLTAVGARAARRERERLLTRLDRAERVCEAANQMRREGYVAITFALDKALDAWQEARG